MADGDSERRVQTTCLMILAAAALAVALYWLRSVMVPFVLAAFAAVSLSPLLDLQVRHLRLPRMAALLTTGLFGLILLCALGLLIAASIGQLESKRPPAPFALDFLVLPAGGSAGLFAVGFVAALSDAVVADGFGV